MPRSFAAPPTASGPTTAAARTSSTSSSSSSLPLSSSESAASAMSRAAMTWKGETFPATSWTRDHLSKHPWNELARPVRRPRQSSLEAWMDSLERTRRNTSDHLSSRETPRPSAPATTSASLSVSISSLNARHIFSRRARALLPSATTPSRRARSTSPARGGVRARPRRDGRGGKRWTAARRRSACGWRRCSRRCGGCAATATRRRTRRRGRRTRRAGSRRRSRSTTREKRAPAPRFSGPAPAPGSSPPPPPRSSRAPRS